MKPLLAGLFLLCLLASGAQNVTIQEMGQSDTDALQKADDDIDQAQTAAAAAERKYHDAIHTYGELLNSVEGKYGKTAEPENCKDGERYHQVTVEVRGKYVVISEGDAPCRITSWQ